MTSVFTPSRTTYSETVLLCLLESYSASVFHITRTIAAIFLAREPTRSLASARAGRCGRLIFTDKIQSRRTVSGRRCQSTLPGRRFRLGIGG